MHDEQRAIRWNGYVCESDKLDMNMLLDPDLRLDRGSVEGSKYCRKKMEGHVRAPQE